LLSHVASLSAGNQHVCALLTDGQVRCWGANYAGQLGTAAEAPSASRNPVAVKLAGEAVTLSAGFSQTCAVLKNGEAECWGKPDLGGSNASQVAQPPVEVPGLTDARSVSVGREQACAVLADGSVKCWGGNTFGELGNGSYASSVDALQVTGLSGSAIAISAANDHTGALATDGAISCWGETWIESMTAGDNVKLTSTSEPTPLAVSGIADATAISSALGYTCALLADATIRCWGSNAHGNLGNGSSVSSTTPVTVAALSGATAIAAADDHACALLQDGHVACWGSNNSGQLGDRTQTSSATPVGVVGIDNASAVSAGYGFTCALLADQTVRCWGETLPGCDTCPRDSLVPESVQAPL
jgi:alpha-tubulin suppressor-like RCC1 family protein